MPAIRPRRSHDSKHVVCDANPLATARLYPQAGPPIRPRVTAAYFPATMNTSPSPADTGAVTVSAFADRAAGAILGALVGDTLAVGPHWYYDLDELHRDYGPWITGYTDPKPGRYHAGMRAGELSQSGLLLALLLRSVAEGGDYDEADWTRRMDADFLPRLDGSPGDGPGGYTNQDIRDVYRRRVVERRPWGECASPADTTEAAQRAVVLAARYAADPGGAMRRSTAHVRLTQDDGLVASLSVGFGCVVSALVRGDPLDATVSDRLMALAHDGTLPFMTVTTRDLRPPASAATTATVPHDKVPDKPLFPSPDALLLPGYCAEAARHPDIRIEPAWKAALVYGLPCAIYGPLPAAYYLAARFPGDFENAVLHALNGGGQNMARAALTGALVGAQVGVTGIPARFLDGLHDGTELVSMAKKVAADAEAAAQSA